MHHQQSKQLYNFWTTTSNVMRKYLESITPQRPSNKLKFSRSIGFLLASLSPIESSVTYTFFIFVIFVTLPTSWFLYRISLCSLKGWPDLICVCFSFLLYRLYDISYISVALSQYYLSFLYFYLKTFAFLPSTLVVYRTSIVHRSRERLTWQLSVRLQVKTIVS